MSNQEALKELRKHNELKQSGFAGVDKQGQIVDRRICPTAIPMQKNSLLDIPEPKSIINTERTFKTVTGHYIDVFDPQQEHITIEDIAHALSLTARWGGHTHAFYSVASHSLWVADNVQPEFQLEALLHDATEAYIGDMPKPIKRHLPDYNKLEQVLDQAIRTKFNLPVSISQSVKEADKKALEWELNYIKESQAHYNCPHGIVRKKFLDKYYTLINK